MPSTEDAKRAADDVQRKAERASEHPVFRGFARGGFAMSGLVHVMIGWIALRLAFGGGGGEADQSGALGAFASAPGGEILLGIGAAAMFALAVWYLVQGVVGARRAREAKDTAKEALKGVGAAIVYAAIGATALRFALGSGSNSKQTTSSASGTVMGSPFGQALIVVVGLVVLGIGVWFVYKGIARRFEKDLEPIGSQTARTAVMLTGVTGHVAKGVALAAVGVLLAWAGLREQPEQATGMDGALRSIAQLPAGTILLSLVGVGLVLYGIYAVLRARYADMSEV